MTGLRRLSYAALVLAVVHIIFGAIVRISGSGFGCGDDWPRCEGAWFPALDRPDLIIEYFHRVLASVLSLVILAILVMAWRRRTQPGVGGRGGVLRAAILATVVVTVTALFGAVIVKLELQNRLVVVTHLVLAMVLLGALVSAAMRAGGFGARALEVAIGTRPADGGAGGPGARTEGTGGVSPRTARVATIGAGITFIVILFGALTANFPGAAESCLGFPHCRVAMQSVGGLLHLQLTHRILAFLLLFHMLGAMIAVGRRGEASPVVTAARLAFAAIVLQILVAAAMVEMRLPPVLQSVHQAVGTLVWVAVIAFALLARRGAHVGFAPARSTTSDRLTPDAAVRYTPRGAES